MEWTERDDASAYAESLPPHHPTRTVDAFMHAVVRFDEPGALAVLAALITPESATDSWGDFDDVRAFVTIGIRISTAPWYGIGAPDVAYVKFVADEGPWIRDDVR